MARTLLIFVMAMIVAATAPLGAAAREAVDFSANDAEGVTRLVMTWPKARTPNPPRAEVRNGVLIITFAQPISGDPSVLAGKASSDIAAVRLDEDGRALRVALRRSVRPNVTRSYNLVGVDLVPPGSEAPAPILSPLAQAKKAARAEARRRSIAPPPPPPDPDDVRVRIAQASEYARIAFDWPTPVGHALQVENGRATLTFDRRGELANAARLRIDPPRGLTAADWANTDERLVMTFALEAGVLARAWSDDARVVLDVIPGGAGQIAAGDEPGHDAHDGSDDHQLAHSGHDDGAHAVDHAKDHRADDHAPDDAQSNAHHVDHDNDDHHVLALVAPDDDSMGGAAVRSAPGYDPALAAPGDGVIRVEATPRAGGVRAVFAWNGPVGAAVFRRGEAAWIVFDAPAFVELDELLRAGGRHVRAARAYEGADYTAVRLESPPATQISPQRDGGVWTFDFDEASTVRTKPAKLIRHAMAGRPARLFLQLPGANGVRSVHDPVVGDTIDVATSITPAAGLRTARTGMDVAALATAHGGAFLVRRDGVTLGLTRDGVEITRAGGLALSADLNAGSSAIAASPGFIDFDGWGAPTGGFVSGHDAAALDAAMEEEPGEGRLGLARFLLGEELAAEALGVLRALAGDDPAYARDARFIAMKGAANIMMKRYEIAERDFAAPALSNDPAASLWRSLLAYEERDWRETRREFEAGREALYNFRRDWRARFRLADAEAALNLGDLQTVQRVVRDLESEKTDAELAARATLLNARFHAASGEFDKAVELAKKVAQSGYEPLEATALYDTVRWDRERGVLAPAEAIEILDGLRYRWRGGALEVDIAAELGRLHIAGGDVHSGLTAMRAALSQFTASSAARALSTEMGDVFRELYLEGGADRLDPIEALALYYEFAELTPVGADGDRMIRRLSDRLIDFDLLEPAAQLLRHQVDERLNGVGRAQVAVDLAAIYMMNRQPEEALVTLRETRFPRLPARTQRARLFLESRALGEIGRHEHALELLEGESGDEAMALRADIAWATRDWSLAGRYLDAALSSMVRREGALTADEEGVVMRAAVAHTLADDRARLDDLTDRFGARMEAGRQAASWRVITGDAGVDEGVRLRDVARVAAGVETLDAFLDQIRAARLAEIAAADDAQAGEPDSGS